jgi:hypothetical protein
MYVFDFLSELTGSFAKPAQAHPTGDVDEVESAFGCGIVERTA